MNNNFYVHDLDELYFLFCLARFNEYLDLLEEIVGLLTISSSELFFSLKMASKFYKEQKGFVGTFKASCYFIKQFEKVLEDPQKSIRQL